MTQKELYFMSLRRTKLLRFFTYASAGLVFLATVFFLTRLFVKRADDHAKVVAHLADASSIESNAIDKNKVRPATIASVHDIIDLTVRIKNPER